MSALKKLKRSAVYNLARCFVFVANLVSRRTALFLGAMLSLAAWKLLAREQHRVHRHLALAYGDRLSYRQRERIGRSMFINYGKDIADLVRLKKHYATEIKPIVELEGFEHFDRAYRRGKGVIGVTGHIGNFELLAAHVSSLGYDIAVIGRELYEPRLNELLVGHRESFGLTNISTTESPRKMMSWLKAGKAVGVLIDNDSSRVRGAFVPVFGRWANTPIGQSIIGLRVGAAFVPIVCLRTDNDRYRIVAKPPIEIDPSGDFDQDVYAMTRMCTRQLETIIDGNREQWVWLHNRWRTRMPKPA